jgi:hypothetical protein
LGESVQGDVEACLMVLEDSVHRCLWHSGLQCFLRYSHDASLEDWECWTVQKTGIFWFVEYGHDVVDVE